MKKDRKFYRKEKRQLCHYVVRHTTYTSSDVRSFSYSRLFMLLIKYLIGDVLNLNFLLAVRFRLRYSDPPA